MGVSMKELGIDKFTAEDRFTLLQEIWDSLVPDVERSPITVAQQRELERRLAAHEASPGNVIPWEVVKAQALARARQ